VGYTIDTGDGSCCPETKSSPEDGELFVLLPIRRHHFINGGNKSIESFVIITFIATKRDT